MTHQIPNARTITAAQALAFLTMYRIQAVEIDPDNPRGIRFLLDKQHTISMVPMDSRLHFALSIG